MIKLPYRDYTIKAVLYDPQIMEDMLHQMNAHYTGLDIQTDHYFEVPQGKLKWRQGTIENLITHYERIDESGIEQTIVYRYDKDPSIQEIKLLHKQYKKIGATHKERKIYTVGAIKIHLDKLDTGRTFIEIEAIDLEYKFSREELKRKCLSLKSELGLLDKDLVKTGYFGSS